VRVEETSNNSFEYPVPRGVNASRYGKGSAG
jgi:hypothetical protein